MRSIPGTAAATYRSASTAGDRSPTPMRLDTSIMLRPFPHRLTYDLAPDALDVYRRALMGEPDHSVTIVSVGFLNNLLARLLRAEADLVAGKVEKLVIMGGRHNDGFNLVRHDLVETNPGGDGELADAACHLRLRRPPPHRRVARGGPLLATRFGKPTTGGSATRSWDDQVGTRLPCSTASTVQGTGSRMSQAAREACATGIPGS